MDDLSNCRGQGTVRVANLPSEMERGGLPKELGVVRYGALIDDKVVLASTATPLGASRPPQPSTLPI